MMSDSFAILWTVALQVPLSMGFPRQEYWSRLPLPSPADFSQSRDQIRASCLAGRFFTTEPPGKVKVKVKLLSCVQLFVTWWTVAYQAAPTRLLLPWEFPGKNTGVGCHFLLQRNLPNPGIKPGSPALQADTLPSEPPEKSSSHLESPRINID